MAETSCQESYSKKSINTSETLDFQYLKNVFIVENFVSKKQKEYKAQENAFNYPDLVLLYGG